MNWTPRHYVVGFWCWLCYRAYLTLPMSGSHESLYGRFSLWLLGFAGAYAHSDRDTFPLCLFFYRSKEEQSVAWDAFLASRLSSTNHPGADATTAVTSQEP